MIQYKPWLPFVVLTVILSFSICAREADTGPFFDIDEDGVSDQSDNCINVPNGTNNNIDPNACQIFQYDVDNDGYGNVCDADLDNDGIAGGTDWLILARNYGMVSDIADITCNGIVDAPDIMAFLVSFGNPPGPSGIVE